MVVCTNYYRIPPTLDNTEYMMKSNWTPDSMLSRADLDHQTVPLYTDSNGRWAGLFIGVHDFSADEAGVCGQVKSHSKVGSKGRL